MTPGLELAARLYEDPVGPKLAGVPHAAALLGDGSEVLGFDDEVSTDHDFDARLQVFVAAGTETPPLPPAVEVTTVSRFFGDRLGFDPLGPIAVDDWLATPTQRLATLTAGAVFADTPGELTAARDALAWYPTDVWRYVLAAQWLRVSQEEAFVGRTGATGDDLGSRLVAARLVRDLIRLAFLVERRWAPYGKWLGRAFTGLGCAAAVGPHLEAALAAAGWREREAELCAATERLITATNELALARPVDPGRRQFHERDIQVLDAARVTVALVDAVEDPAVRDVVDRDGRRPRDGVPRLVGAVDQFVDSTDVLTHPDRCRQIAEAFWRP